MAKLNAARNNGQMKAEDEVHGWIARLVELTQSAPEATEDPPEPEDLSDDPYLENPEDFRYDERG